MSGSERHGRRKRAGQTDVARALGVSQTTVSNAFIRPDRLSADLRQRILHTAAELGYGGPDPAARSLRTGRVGAFGVVLAERLAYAFGDPAAVRFLQGVADATATHPLTLVLVPSSPDSASAAAAARRAAVDGFIVYSTPSDNAAFQAALARRRPTIVVDSPATEGLDFVGIDDRAAAETAARHLIELGHRRLGVITLQLTATEQIGPADDARQTAATSTWPRARLEGCGSALAAAGLDPSHLTVDERRTSSVEEGRAAAHALLDRAPRTTAIFAFSDLLALGARLAAGERGLAVPDDLSVLGFDDTVPAPEGLSTVQQPHYDKGRVAAERLIAALGERPPPPCTELLPTRLLIRDSTSRPRGRSA
jgi:DNA-binding LacI/PurR family transcriptional regulator